MEDDVDVKRPFFLGILDSRVDGKLSTEFVEAAAHELDAAIEEARSNADEYGGEILIYKCTLVATVKRGRPIVRRL